jgi:membrane protease YdiL (CAAX protease family)
MRVVAAYLLIWLLLASVSRAREVVLAQFGRLLQAMRRLFWLGALAGAFLVAVNGALLLASRSVTFVPSHQLSGGPLLFAVGFAALVATTEEMLVRGLLLTRLREIWTTAGAVLATSLVFSIMHVGRGDFSLLTTAQYFVDGVLLAWMVLVTGDIWMATGFHFAKNLGVYALFGGSRHLLPPLFTPPGPTPVVDLLTYAATVPVVWLLLSRQARFSDAHHDS